MTPSGRLSDGGFLFTTTGKVSYYFDGTGRIREIADRHGNTILLSYAGGNLSAVTDTASRRIVFNYGFFNGASRITSIQGPDRPPIRYGYDSLGNLISVTDARGHTMNYGYDSNHEDNHLLDTIINRNRKG